MNYYDREAATKDDNPTIGLVLCSEKNDAVVRYVLAEKNSQVFASRYQFALPSEADLRAEIRRELEQLDSGSPGTPADGAKGKPATKARAKSKEQAGKAKKGTRP